MSEQSHDLSERDIQILRCLLNGNTNKVISRKLGITEYTIGQHMKAMFQKIGAVNRTQAAVWALNNGLSAD